MLKILLAAGASLTLAATSVSAQGLINPRICERHDLSELSEETRAFCETIDGLKGRDLFKAWVLENLRRTNRPPVAALEVFDRVGEGNPVRPGRVDLDASGSFDLDELGTIEHYRFQLFDADTGEVLGTTVTRQPMASVIVDRELPPNLRAEVEVEDDEGATDTTEVSFLGPDVTASTDKFSCSSYPGGTECVPTSTNTAFTTDELLEAAQQIDSNIAKTTPLRIAAWGGGGGRGANFWPEVGSPGGNTGLASMGTTLMDLDTTYGGPETITYCYGIGQQGTFTSNESGAGGASTILRTCQNVSQTNIINVLLIAGGGAGGAEGSGEVGFGGAGGIAFSTETDACPPSCATGSSTNGGGDEGGAPATGGGNAGRGGSGGSGGAGGDDNGLNEPGNPGADGIGGKGGKAPNTGIAGWSQGDPKVTSDTGSGALSNPGWKGGAGGGGYGGGGSGGIAFNTSRGGGGGGSFAAKSTQPYDYPSRGGGPLPGSLGFFFAP